MTLVHEAIADKKYDSRLVERSVSRGQLSQADLDKHVKSLPDEASNAIQVSWGELEAQDHRSTGRY